MITLYIVLLFLLAIGAVINVYFMRRNYLIYSVRMFFLAEDNSLYPAQYDKLPSYHDMLYKLKYQKLKTPEQWVEWTRTQ